MTHDTNRFSRARVARPGLGLAAWLIATLMASPAQAWVVPGPLAATLGCTAQAAFYAPTVALDGSAPATKSAAILGAKLSALDMITLQQQQGSASVVSDRRPAETPVALATDAGLACSLAPSAVLLASPLPSITPPASEDFLGSSRIAIGKTPFDRTWRRVSRGTLSRTRVANILGRPSEQGLDLLAMVNRWVNQNIEFTRDDRLYGQRDFWASATQTLKAGKGDCEDYGILKYQMLAALGFDRDEMYLTLTRDLVRNEDHTVLIVRLGGNHFMLDNATDTVLPADLSHDYRAIMTLSSRGSWVHGFTSPPRMAALVPQRLSYFSESAVSSARVTGLSR